MTEATSTKFALKPLKAFFFFFLLAKNAAVSDKAAVSDMVGVAFAWTRQEYECQMFTIVQLCTVQYVECAGQEGPLNEKLSFFTSESNRHLPDLPGVTDV